MLNKHYNIAQLPPYLTTFSDPDVDDYHIIKITVSQCLLVTNGWFEYEKTLVAGKL